MDNNYYVVEFRLPFQIDDASSPAEAAAKARRILERDSGLDVSSWFTRVFEYSDDYENVGPVAEYFCNPSGTHFRKIDQNVESHERMVEDEEVHD